MALALAACASTPTAPAATSAPATSSSASASETPTESPTPEAPADASPFSGLPGGADKPVLVVKFDNTTYADDRRIEQVEDQIEVRPMHLPFDQGRRQSGAQLLTGQRGQTCDRTHGVEVFTKRHRHSGSSQFFDEPDLTVEQRHRRNSLIARS